MNELRGPPDKLPQTEFRLIRNFHKIHDLVFWHANCIRLIRLEAEEKLPNTDSWRDKASD
jgi:hypothetical protein